MAERVAACSFDRPGPGHRLRDSCLDDGFIGVVPPWPARSRLWIFITRARCCFTAAGTAQGLIPLPGKCVRVRERKRPDLHKSCRSGRGFFLLT